MFIDLFSYFQTMIPEGWLPSSENFVTQGQAILIIMLCLVLIAATLFLLLSWIVSRDLQSNTVGVALFYVMFLSWIASLPRTGNVLLAGGLLIGLLLSTLIFITIHYGVSSPSVTAFLLPIVISTVVLNTAVGFAVTLCCILFIWLAAFVEHQGWRKPMLPVSRDNLTFKAPMFTVIFTAVFILIGGWTDYLMVNIGS